MKSNPCFVSVASAAFAALLACAPLAQAHNVWLEPDADGAYTVQFGGHEGKLESFAADKLKSVHAYDARGRSIDVAVRPVAGGARVVPARKAALLAAHFDNGFFSRVGEGPMVEKPMTENPGATSGVHALKFHKTILEWGPVTREKLGQTQEIIAKTRRSPHAGEPQQFQVLLDGQPRAGVRVSLGESGPPLATDADGLVTVTPRAGMNQLLAIVRLPVAGDARTTSLSYEYLLGFSAH
jgi:nickel transport protein